MISVRRDALGGLKPLNSGSQAILYRAPAVTLPGSDGPYVYKEYRSKVRSGIEHGIRRSLVGLIRVRSGATPAQRQRIDASSVWPVAVVEDHVGAIGLLMREIPDRFFVQVTTSSGKTFRDPAEASLYLQPEADIRARNLTPLTLHGRLYLTARLLRYVALMHELDVVIGDFSSANVLFFIHPTEQKERNSVMFVDVDSYRLGSGVPALVQGHTPDWQTPENAKRSALYKSLVAAGASANQIASARAAVDIQDKRSDVFKTAILILRLFDGGEKSLSTRHSPESMAKITKFRGKRFAATLAAALAAEPKDRPTIDVLFDDFVRQS
ncbi:MULTISPECIES: hypothetical protein [unclassified Cryobacterium]|uniref:hypothetical protein n=1 Tax=unclassified Cryobacterium TaxID=2649013 RepID=UPI00106DB4CF|nr:MULTISPECIES: hypothetical protein [unclassified Cryobacterium]TFB96275.1 hypothetical protein E3O39_09215 [Cryobacterium sp. MDB2-A-1]